MVVTLLQVAARAVRTREVRAAAWFERYAWFVSSENCLVLSARDGQQADLLLKRHMRCEVLMNFISCPTPRHYKVEYHSMVHRSMAEPVHMHFG